MWLFVGLGNPGTQHIRNRHNIGFLTLDSIIEQSAGAFSGYRVKFQGLISEGRVSGKKVILLKPQTYMNNSGNSVGSVAKFYKIDPDKIVVFHDDLDLVSGDVRIKQGGGNAGHNGLNSVQAHLGAADFWRVRIGIGRPDYKGQVTNYVLSDFSKEECEYLIPLVDFMGDKAGKIVEENPETYGVLIKEYIKNNQEQE
ncbi:MAG: aminoacyl-tRNA hydrolase [Alphaproteobacteria bacterium]|nr:aminoacyl-tRNA hydrolase [Alphaproteobacteria bacterium]